MKPEDKTYLDTTAYDSAERTKRQQEQASDYMKSGIRLIVLLKGLLTVGSDLLRIFQTLSAISWVSDLLKLIPVVGSLIAAGLLLIEISKISDDKETADWQKALKITLLFAAVSMLTIVSVCSLFITFGAVVSLGLHVLPLVLIALDMVIDMFQIYKKIKNDSGNMDDKVALKQQFIKKGVNLVAVLFSIAVIILAFVAAPHVAIIVLLAIAAAIVTAKIAWGLFPKSWKQNIKTLFGLGKDSYKDDSKQNDDKIASIDEKKVVLADGPPGDLGPKASAPIAIPNHNDSGTEVLANGVGDDLVNAESESQLNQLQSEISDDNDLQFNLEMGEEGESPTEHSSSDNDLSVGEVKSLLSSKTTSQSLPGGGSTSQILLALGGGYDPRAVITPPKKSERISSEPIDVVNSEKKGNDLVTEVFNSSTSFKI